MYDFYIKYKVFFQDCGEFRLYFLIKDCFIYIVFYMFFMCLSLLCGRGRGCAARRGRRPLELLGHANTRSSFLLHLCLPILLMQELWSSSFKNAPALNALPVHLLRQVYFLLIFESFLDVSFLFVFWKVLQGSLGALGSILESFGGHVEVILVTFGR